MAAEDQVAAFHATDIRIRAETLLQLAQGVGAEQAHAHIHRAAELRADGRGGQGGGGPRIGRVALQHQDAAAKAEFAQEIGGAGSDDGAADDGHRPGGVGALR